MEYPKDRTPVKLVRIRHKKKSLKLAVYETANTFDLYIGGPDVYCINAFINKPTSIYVQHGTAELSVGSISNILYNIECSMEYNFQKGLDTTAIVRLLISYVKNQYPYVSTLTFNDMSHKTCDNDQNVELSEMTYIRTGITWYQKHFRAYLNEKDQARFLERDAKFQALKAKFTWAQMKSIMGTESLDEDYARTLFEGAATWQEFFRPLSDTMGIAEFCIFVAPWLHSFLLHTLRFNFSGPRYSIPLEGAEILDYEEVAFARGGKRFTRKQLKQRPLSIME
jgi:hypothetical protein